MRKVLLEKENGGVRVGVRVCGRWRLWMSMRSNESESEGIVLRYESYQVFCIFSNILYCVCYLHFAKILLNDVLLIMLFDMHKKRCAQSVIFPTQTYSPSGPFDPSIRHI